MPEQTDRPQRTAPAPPAFHVMAKPAGARCNLACDYCFFLKKERLYPGSDFRMSDTVLESYLRQTIEAHRAPETTIAWQGGEPTLMGLGFFRRAAALEERFRKPGMRVFNTLQTNGTLLDDAWCAFLKEHGFLVGLSMDGPGDLHDAYRRDKTGSGTFDRVFRSLRLLQKHGVEHNVLCTVNATNADEPLRVYRFFRDEATVRFIQFIPIVERDNDAGDQTGDRVTDRSVSGAQWGRFLTAIFDEWVRRDVGTMFVQLFDGTLAAWLGGESSLCVFRKTCGDGVALEHTGDLYSCDHFVEPAHLLGNITGQPLAGLLASEQQRRFGRAKSAALPRYCRACPYLFACNGECPKNRLLTTPDGEPGLNWLCEGLKAFFARVDRPMRIMADLLRRGRPAAAVMKVLAAENARLDAALRHAGRNDPCPCGSGRKVKKCHGGTAPSEGAPRSR